MGQKFKPCAVIWYEACAVLQTFLEWLDSRGVRIFRRQPHPIGNYPPRGWLWHWIDDCEVHVDYRAKERPLKALKGWCAWIQLRFSIWKQEKFTWLPGLEQLLGQMDCRWALGCKTNSNQRQRHFSLPNTRFSRCASPRPYHKNNMKAEYPCQYYENRSPKGTWTEWHG